jgi:hypothetical protein
VSLRFVRTALPEAVGPWTLWSAGPSAAGARADLATESLPQILSYLSGIPDVTVRPVRVALRPDHLADRADLRTR